MRNPFMNIMPYMLNMPPPISQPIMNSVSHGFIQGQDFNRTGKTFKRNKRYQMKHGFKARRK